MSAVFIIVVVAIIFLLLVFKFDGVMGRGGCSGCTDGMSVHTANLPCEITC